MHLDVPFNITNNNGEVVSPLESVEEQGTRGSHNREANGVQVFLVVAEFVQGGLVFWQGNKFSCGNHCCWCSWVFIYPGGTAQLLWFGKFFLVAKVAHEELELLAWRGIFCLCLFYIFVLL